MGQRQFVLFGIVGVIALVVGITVASLNDNLTYYLYPNEAVAQRAEFPDGERFRLAGQVVASSMRTEMTDVRGHRRSADPRRLINLLSIQRRCGAVEGTGVEGFHWRVLS
jgi:cytochrome c-type biogenesis protein CcmE